MIQKLDYGKNETIKKAVLNACETNPVTPSHIGGGSVAEKGKSRILQGDGEKKIGAP
jgi:hypothetical protein